MQANTLVSSVQKRDGNVVSFNQDKITLAVTKALQSTQSGDETMALKVSDKVMEKLQTEAQGKPEYVPSVEHIQDSVEESLMALGFTKAARSYILYREEHAKIRDQQRNILNGRTTKLDLTINSLKILAKRYLQKDENGKVVELPEEMFDRVARVLSNVEKQYGKDATFVDTQYKQFYEIMANSEFTPAGRTLTNAGAPTPVVSNCIVLHPGDSMQDIFQTLKDASMLQQLGSGLGFPWHLLRPAGTKAKRSGGVASGPVSFLRVYNQAFGVIKQQGRHGANMAIMRVDHPDILEFVHCKRVEGDIKNFNISVGLTEEFMDKVIADDPNPYLCEFNGKKMKPQRVKRDQYDSIQDIQEETITAKELFTEIVECAWHNGEPGIVFLDAVNKTNPVPGLGRIEACNPCGEQFLHDGDVCNLGSINLSKFVTNGKVEFERLKEVTRRAVRMLDNVVDITEYPVDRVTKAMQGNRRVGLGIMGFGDLLYQTGIGYNTEEGIAMAEKVMDVIQQAAHQTSQEIAEEKGNFPNYDLSVYKPQKVPMRNAALTTVAPTGTISMMYDCSSGIEPVFALSYYKGQIIGSNTLYYTNPIFENALRERGLFSEELMKKVAEHGSVAHVDEIPEDMKKTFVVAHDIAPIWHVRMQAAFQRHVDNSISKTINFPHDASVEEVKQAYISAYQMGLKGLTVYRDGSRQVEVLTVQDPTKKSVTAENNSTNAQNKGMATQQVHECPNCKKELRMQEGCALCADCGYSYCSL